jgi:glucosyl-3-phosphoglycerate synthase
MSDFFQHGLISTLHRLNTRPLMDRLGPLSERVALVLPCHFREIGSPALDRIIKILNQAEFVSEVVISMNGVSQSDTESTRRFWGQLQLPHIVLWNDCPRLLKQIGKSGFTETPGKGLNLWLAFGWLASTRRPDAVVVHDCDIVNYDINLPLSLTVPVTRLSYRFCKGFYSRVSEELYGRVTRLFVIPFLRSLVRVFGHMPLLDFIDSFRYPLAGEFSMTFETALDLRIVNGWGIEIGNLCDLHRLLEPENICQVDLAMHYDHKHQTLDPQKPGEGLLRMASEIAVALLTNLEREGCFLEEKTLESVHRAYQTSSNAFVKRYQKVAAFNGLPYDIAREAAAAEAFSKVLKTECADFAAGARSATLPPWNRLLKTGDLPDFSRL